MRRFEASPRRATPKGQTFINCTAPPSPGPTYAAQAPAFVAHRLFPSCRHESSGPLPMGESAGVTATDRVPPRPDFLEPVEPSVLRLGPPHQVGIDAFQERMQLGAVEPPVVLHPATHDGIHPPCEVGKVGADLPVNTPPAYPLTHRFERLPRHS